MEKDAGILKHYIDIFNDKSFNEYDVMGFLIGIREEKIMRDCPLVSDFANIVAHRTRTDGIAIKSMQKVIDNGFAKNSSGKVQYFNGIGYDSVMKEIKKIGKEYGIIADKEFLGEFILV